MPCLWSHGSPSDLDAVNDLSSLDSSTALLTTPGSSWVRHSLLRPRAEHCLALAELRMARIESEDTNSETIRVFREMYLIRSSVKF